MDRYTRVVPTVIAISLSVIAIENFGAQAAKAENGVQRVMICAPNGNPCASVNYAGQLNVDAQ